MKAEFTTVSDLQDVRFDYKLEVVRTRKEIVVQLTASYKGFEAVDSIDAKYYNGMPAFVEGPHYAEMLTNVTRGLKSKLWELPV